VPYGGRYRWKRQTYDTRRLAACKQIQREGPPISGRPWLVGRLRPCPKWQGDLISAQHHGNRRCARGLAGLETRKLGVFSFVEACRQARKKQEHGRRQGGNQDPSATAVFTPFVLSNSTWANGVLTPTFRQPFDIIADGAIACAEKKAAGATSSDLCLEMGG
jgi:hypothetical protein